MYALKRKRMSLMPAVALAALGAVVAIPALSSSRLYAAAPERFTTVTVRAGDTLWSLADRRTPSGGDVEQTIDTIVAVNHLDGAANRPGRAHQDPSLRGVLRREETRAALARAALVRCAAFFAIGFGGGTG